ncbi:MAG: HEAT repeat domain-containing protein [Phycisphaerales bacterium]|nr:MAG: HEAT repeat domain-containing protein [Phycisphaerales bacterium]
MHWSRRLSLMVTILFILGPASVLSARSGAADRSCIPELIERLQAPDAAVRRDAAWQLGALRSEAKDAIQPLGKLTGDRDPQVRRAAALALFRIGPAAMEALPWMKKTGMEPITPEQARSAFDRVWETVDREYAMFVIRPDVDWNALRRQYRPEALAARSDTELAVLMSDMLSHLRDLHVWMRVRGNSVPVFSRDYPRNWNGKGPIYEKLVAPAHLVSRRIFWAKTADKIGWIVITGWSEAETVDHFDDILEEMRDTRGLIIDARGNSGGDSMLAALVAARFVDRPRTYMYYRHRTGPAHSDLSERIPRRLTPRGPWRYDRPVILLQGRYCMSANESFCAQMAACPNVTTMGEPTRGSTGFPVWFQCPAGIEVGIPQWIAYQADGEVFDEQGIAPEVPFAWRREAFAGEKDDLLCVALERLRQAPLPAQPIEGPSIAKTRADHEAEMGHAPRVVSVKPQQGSARVTAQTELRIRFDRPMRPSTVHLQWLSGGVREAEAVDYDEATHEFVIPVTLEPGCTHRIAVNLNGEPGAGGFQSAHGTAAAPFEWSFTTAVSAGAGTGGKVEHDAPRDAERTLRRVVAKYNETRQAMRSFAETVRTVECSEPGSSGFTHLKAYSSTFTVRGPQQYLARVGATPGGPLTVFLDGTLNHICGHYRETDGHPEAIAFPSHEVTKEDVTLADPFRSTSDNLDAALDQLALKYAGTDGLNGRPCHIVDSYVRTADPRGVPERR